MSRGADPDKGGEKLLGLSGLLHDGLALLDLGVQLGDLVLRRGLALPLRGVWLGVEHTGTHNVAPVSGPATREVDSGSTPDLNGVITFLMSFNQVKWLNILKHEPKITFIPGSFSIKGRQ